MMFRVLLALTIVLGGLISPVVYPVTNPQPVLAADTLEVRTTANNDDCGRSTNDIDSFNLTAHVTSGRQNGACPPSLTFDYASGMRFNGITIPQGATISAAYITFRAFSSSAVTTVNTRLRGEDTDDAATFSTAANYDARVTTTASTVWNGIGAWTANNDYDSPSIVTIVQEIVDRAGWVSGNSLVIFWEDNGSSTTCSTNPYRDAYSYSDSSDFAPLLHIEFSAPPTVTTGAATGIGANITHCWATLNGDITDDGGEDIIARGFAWGATCNDTAPGTNEAPPASYSDNYTEFSADWGEGAFSFSANLTCCTTYCYRTFAQNSEGYGWGEEQTFTTLCDPDIDVQAASYVQATTARLNSLVIDDGGQASDVRFAYGTSSANCTDDAAGCPTASCNSTSYDTATAWVNDTYTTGQTPFVDITGLATGTTYYFCVQIRNDRSCRCGGELSFTTETGIEAPSELQGIPYHRLSPDLEIPVCSIGLSWVKEGGSTNTLIRYKLGSYPTSIVDGTLVYFDSLTSIVHNSESDMSLGLHEGLTTGTTYYYRAWGESGGVYSTDNVTLMITTLAETPGGDALPSGATPSTWFSTPDETVWSAFPLYGLFNWIADTFEMPRPTFWYLFAMALTVLAGIFIYRVSDKLLIAVVVVAFMIAIGSLMRLLPMWHIVPAIILGITGIIVGERR